MRSSLHGKIIIFDNKVIEFVRDILDSRLTSFFKLMTNSGALYIPIVILVCIFVFIKNKWYFCIETVSYAFAGLVSYIAKLIVARPRPLEALIKMPSTYSFPSGHTLTSLVFYCILFYLLTIKSKRSVKIIGFIFSLSLICIVSVSRIYLGVHYFSDVLGGFIIGIPCVLIIVNTIEKNLKEKLL
ncbi:MAG: phosphatase PAP2 family protein [Bacilli bacterium]|nr:phosphatase PAP2 family protein [Bacilli bacterium]